MRALVVMPVGTARGGAEQQLQHLVDHRAIAGLDLTIAFLEDGSMIPWCLERGVETVLVAAGRTRDPLAYRQAVRRIVRAGRVARPDVVIGWMSKGQVYGGPAARTLGLPAVWVQVGTPAWTLPFDVVATTIPARRIVTVSRQVDAAQRTLWPRRPTTVVYPGVDTTRFDARKLGDRDAVRHRLGLPADAVIVGAVGRLERWKGFHFVVEAFARVADRHPDALLAIVGGTHPLDPGYADELRDLIDGHGRIRLVGQQINPEEWMHAMDVFVHASEGEPFGIVVIEAMALGKPVVASAEGGPSEVITHGVDGLLTPFGDSAGQAAAVIALLEDEDRRRRLGAAARARAQDFAVETFAEEFGRVVRWAAA